MFGRACENKKVVLGFLSRAGLALFLRHFKGFTDFTDFEGCWEKRQSNISDTLDGPALNLCSYHILISSVI